ncbi:hypothetical protein BKA63DRAFT_575416 [Paraphoma chrysanthemicola]|nr:hypothetical protein BKA63DRAFT_575416 [Paraphoma chrysanthemicola]
MDPLLFFLLAIGLCASAYGTQLAYIDINSLPLGAVAKTTNRRVRHLRIGPVVCLILAVLGTIVVPITARADGQPCTNESEDINPDVGGLGVLIGLFSPCFVLLLVMFFGHFSNGNTGAKELCIAQCANLTYLMVNLAKGMSGLNSRELTIAISSIDAVSASVSMSFANKDVLAARKLVSLGFITQLVAFAVEGAAIYSITSGAMITCGTMGSQPFRPASRSWSWVYFVSRITVATLPIGLAFRLTSNLNKIENRSSRSQSMHVRAKQLWIELPTTLSTSYLTFCSFVFLHGISIAMVLHETKPIVRSWKTSWTEWGQSANAIVAVFAIGHVVYVCSRLFRAPNDVSSYDVPVSDEQWIPPPNATSADQRGKRMSVSRLWKTVRRQLQIFGLRWPFHLLLMVPDHLLVDDSSLLKVLMRPLDLSIQDLDRLWERLVLSFQLNDKEAVLDCLEQGAPTDRKDEDGNYPIHLAAALYEDSEILRLARSKPRPGSDAKDNLLLQDRNNQTPLEIAINEKKLGAVRWITANLPRENDEATLSACRAFELAIMKERLEVLDTLTHCWPTWRTLEIGRKEQKHSPFYFAIHQKKEKAARHLFPDLHYRNKSVISSTLIDLAWKTYHTNLMHCILEGDPRTISTQPWDVLEHDERVPSCGHQMKQSSVARGIVGAILRSPLNTDEVLALSKELGITADFLLTIHVKLASRAKTPPRRPELCDRLLLSVAALKPATSKSVLTSLAIPLEVLDATDADDLAQVQLKKALNRKSARSRLYKRHIFTLLAARSDVATTSEALRTIVNKYPYTESWQNFYFKVAVLLVFGANPALSDDCNHRPREHLLKTTRCHKICSDPWHKYGKNSSMHIDYRTSASGLLKLAEDFYRTQGEDNPLLPSNGMSTRDKIGIVQSWEDQMRSGRSNPAPLEVAHNIGWIENIINNDVPLLSRYRVLAEVYMHTWSVNYA